MKGFWGNWTMRKTSFGDGYWFSELSFFSNNYNQCERTLEEACKRLGVSEFGISPEIGGGYSGKLIIKGAQK